MRQTKAPAPEKILAGLQAQIERSGRFASTIDPVAALQTYDRLIRLLQPRLPDMRRSVGLPAEPQPFAALRARVEARRRFRHKRVPSDRVFTYWNTSVDSAPALVQACLANIGRAYPALEVLDGRSVRTLIDIPERISSLLENDRPAHFSDYVRTRILEEHGGLWFDATAWVGHNLDMELQRRYLRAGTIFPRWTKLSIANWFIASQQGSVLLGMQRRALDEWWNHNDDLPDYFLYHRIFEVLQVMVPEVRGQWDAAPPLSATSAHLLQLEMMQPWRPNTLADIDAVAPLQKLSYKYDTVPEGSVLEHLIAPYDSTPPTDEAGT